ncbi:hypothetical protein CASFOL_003790 [Castilleja foliolosa]|uniref:MORF/ORRM1/DAG-like MORF domain-containing protein n=1 Tax=Castilleja foliolosa TaxID=1961234 RepID=A0ABD3EM30_9LAMI
MALARAQICRVSKRMFSGISIPHPPPHPKITGDKFSFLDAVPVTPFPACRGDPINLFRFYIKSSYLKGATQEEKMNFYIKTAAQVIGSEEEAKDRIRMITCDCSFDGFGLEICYDVAYKIAGLESVDHLASPYAGMVPFSDGELIRWSLIPKRREKCRFPLPKPDLDINCDSDDEGTGPSYCAQVRKIENEMEYD